MEDGSPKWTCRHSKVNQTVKVKGIVIASGIYTNTSKKAHEYSMEKIIGTNIMTSILVVHHKKDMCKVTQFAYAQQFISSLNAPKKDTLFYVSAWLSPLVLFSSRVFSNSCSYSPTFNLRKRSIEIYL